MRKIIVLISLVLILISCNDVFDMYYGEDLYLLENYVNTTDWPCTWSMHKSIGDYERVYTFTEERELKLIIRLYTESGKRYDWFIEYTYY